jgi:hypothetical protein
LFDALTDFLDAVPRSILATSTALPTHLLRPPAVHWGRLPKTARGNYWAMVRRALRADPRMARRIAWLRVAEPAFVFGRMDPPVGPMAASAVLSTVAVLSAIGRRLRGR